MKNVLLHKSEISEFKKIYDDMLIQFPKNELKSYSKFIQLLKSENYNFYVVTTNNEDVGYCIVRIDPEMNTMWLDYIAIFKKFHSTGWGSKIINSLISNFQNLHGCFLEVEKVNEKIPNSIRRVNFYTKLGALKLDCDYFYPHKDGALAMDLYFLPFQKNFQIDKTTTKKAIINAFMTLHSDLPHLQEVLAKIN